MKRAGVALLALVAVIAAVAVGLNTWGSSEFTECYALFPSESDAEAVVDDLPDDPSVELESERRGDEVAATFHTGATGEDARPLVEAFRPAVRAHGGTLGHPGEGCLERGPIN